MHFKVPVTPLHYVQPAEPPNPTSVQSLQEVVINPYEDEHVVQLPTELHKLHPAEQALQSMVPKLIKKYLS